MKKQQMLFIIVLVMLIFIGILSLLIYKKTSSQSTITTTTPAPTIPLSATIAPTTNPKALNNVLHLAKTQKCTVTDTNGITETYYMSGTMIRAEYASSNIKQKVQLLADGELVYIWVDSTNKGSSIDELDTDTVNSVMQEKGLSGFDINAKRNLQCQKWTANPAVLAAPYTVVFTSINK